MRGGMAMPLPPCGPWHGKGEDITQSQAAEGPRVHFQHQRLPRPGVHFDPIRLAIQGDYLSLHGPLVGVAELHVCYRL
jgi:hypothetical protein